MGPSLSRGNLRRERPSIGFLFCSGPKSKPRISCCFRTMPPKLGAPVFPYCSSCKEGSPSVPSTSSTQSCLPQVRGREKWRNEWEKFLGQLREGTSSRLPFRCYCASGIPAVHLHPGRLYPTPVPAATVPLKVSGLQAVSCPLQLSSPGVSSFPSTVPSDQDP